MGEFRPNLKSDEAATFQAGRGWWVGGRGGGEVVGWVGWVEVVGWVGWVGVEGWGEVVLGGGSGW